MGLLYQVCVYDGDGYLFQNDDERCHNGKAFSLLCPYNETYTYQHIKHLGIQWQIVRFLELMNL